jgi:hypothetical protein
MSRAQINAPTDRIMRMLQEFDALESWGDHLLATLQAIAPDLLADLPAKPYLYALVEERQRQQMTHGKTLRKRKYMTQVRTASDSLGSAAGSMRQAKAVAPVMAAERKAEIDKLIAGMEQDPSEVIPIEDLPKVAGPLALGVEIEADPEASGDDLLQGLGKGGFKLG